MSFSSAISGLNAFSRSIDVTGNNIANANTPGFKTQSLIFAEKLSQSLGKINESGGGSGVDIVAKRVDFSQGALDSSSNTLDLAIRGDGFFRVETTDGATAFTRAGLFTLNNEDYITDMTGNYLTGYAPDASGNITSGNSSRIHISRDDIQPFATQNVHMGLNLSANDPIKAGVFDPKVSSSYNLTSSINTFDSLGVPHTLRVYYKKITGTPTGNKWEVYGTLDDTKIGDTGKLAEVEFDNNGKLKAGSPSSFPVTQAITTGATSPFNFTLDLSQTTQYASAGVISNVTQDGYGPGSLKNIDIDENGIITGSYDNDNKRVLGQITLSKFSNDQGLNNIGNGLYLETNSSGRAITEKPNTRGLGSISSHALEKSNVNVTQQLVNLIIEQRAFQANVQTIKTEDQVQQSIIQIR